MYQLSDAATAALIRFTDEFEAVIPTVLMTDADLRRLDPALRAWGEDPSPANARAVRAFESDAPEGADL